MTSNTSKGLFLAACRVEPVERVPVWIMRQAGRYLPGYRALREKHSFLALCKTPELAAQVSLEPLTVLGVDAAIVFSDILIVAEAMGMELEVGDAGPILPSTIQGRKTIDALREFDPAQETRFVLEAIGQLARAAGRDVPVIGFAAAPWTLACYMIEGQAAGTFARAKQMIYSDGELVHLLLEKIARVTARYLQAQISAGAAAVQLFDTWAGELSRADYDAFALPATQLLIQELAPGSTPVILYTKGSAHLLESVRRAGASVLSVDWRIDLAEARALLGPAIALQGNVDPCMLLGPQQTIGAAAREAIGKTGGRGHILNLGHGILPQTRVEHARAFVRAGQEARLETPAQ